MPNIEKAKNQAGKTIFPVTVADAVLMGNGKTLKGELTELGSKVGIEDVLSIEDANVWFYVKYNFIAGRTYIIKSDKRVAYACTLPTKSYSESAIIDDIGTLEAGVEYELEASANSSYFCTYSNLIANVSVREKDSEVYKLQLLIRNNSKEIENDRLRYNVSAYIADGNIFRWDTSQANRKIYFDNNIVVKYVDTEAGYEFPWDRIKASAALAGYTTNDEEKSVAVGNLGSLYFSTKNKEIVFGDNLLALNKEYIVLFSCFYVGVFTGLLVKDAIEKQHSINKEKQENIDSKISILTNIVNAVAYISDGLSFRWDKQQTNKKIYFDSSLNIKYIDGQAAYEFYWEDIKSAAETAGLVTNDSEMSIVVGVTGSMWFNVDSKSIEFSSNNVLGADKKYLPLFVTHWASYVYGLLVDSEIIKLSKKNESDIEKLKNGIGSNGSIVSYNGYDDVLEKIIQSQRLAPEGVTPNPEDKKNVLTLIHMSDLHGDNSNIARIIEFGEAYNKYIDDIIHTGDLTLNYMEDSLPSASGFEKVLNVIGNHDAWRSGESFYNATQKECYDRFFFGKIDNWGVQQPSDAESLGCCYYYKDYDSAKVRLIVLDCMHYDSEQNDWFASVLSDAKSNGLSVMVAQHYPAFNGVEKLETPFCDYQHTIEKKSGGYAPAYERMNDDAYVRVDEFIANGGTFICWLEGHTHYTMIGRTPEHNNQLQIIVDNAGANDRYNSASRVRGTKTQDAFFVISVDTQSKLVKVIRVGSQLDRFMRKMDVFSYDYGSDKHITG